MEVTTPQEPADQSNEAEDSVALTESASDSLEANASQELDASDESDTPEDDNELDGSERGGSGDDSDVVQDADDDGDDDDDDDDDDDGDDADEDDDAERDADELKKVFGDEHVEYDASEWSGQSRSLFDAMLSSANIRHIWQGASLIASASDEEAIDLLIDEVAGAATPALEIGRERAVYAVGEWSAAMQTSLADTLAVAGIPYEWDENGDLVIYSEDEGRVDAILDDMPDPDDEELQEDDGQDAHEVLAGIWDASGVLAKRPNDAESVVKLAGLVEDLERVGLPFGFESAVWRDLVSKSVAVRDMLEATDEDEQVVADDADLQEACKALHQQLRGFV